MPAGNPGGYIAPQGRPVSAPGIGRDSKRHDLERPKTPGLHNSSLQYGDVQRLSAAQSVAPPLKQQNPVASSAGGGVSPSPSGATGGRGISVPSPIDFAKSRLGGTLGRAPAENLSSVDPSSWVPIFRRLANAPRASGILRNALTAQISNLVNNPVTPRGQVVDMDELDADLEFFSNAF